jgi:hypothetical protein
MTDCEFLLEVLADGREHTLTDILRASIDQRGHGLTVHSRVADLRTRGHEIEHVTIPGAQRGAGHAYRLHIASLAEPEALPAPTPTAAGAPRVSGSADDELSLFDLAGPARGAYDQGVAA